MVRQRLNFIFNNLNTYFMINVKFIADNQNVHIEYTKNGRVFTELYCIAIDRNHALNIANALHYAWNNIPDHFLE